jgi:hypothetical protein
MFFALIGILEQYDLDNAILIDYCPQDTNGFYDINYAFIFTYIDINYCSQDTSNFNQGSFNTAKFTVADGFCPLYVSPSDYIII